MAKDSSATSDVFQNPDGSFTRKVYAGRHNFQAGDGSWTPIDTSLSKQADGRWHEVANAFGVDVADSADDAALASLSLDAGHSVGYGLQGAAKVAPTVSGSTVMYPGVFAGTDLSLTTTPTGVKESLILHSASAATSWVFPLRLRGLTPRVESDGSVSFVDSAGAVQATVPPGVMTDAKPGGPASSQAVAYSLTTGSDGGPALALSVDSVWLNDPARVFPVTVDPTLNTTSSWSTFADTAVPGNNSGAALLNVGTKDGTEKSNSFLQFSSFGSSYGGATISGVSLNLRDVWAGSCTATAVSVSPVSQVWTPSGVSAYPGPSFGSAIGTLTQAPGAACSNTGLNPATGVWMAVTLSTATFTNWANGGDNYGLAVTASQTDTTAWKQFASSTTGAYAPYLQVTYTGNIKPVLDGQSPANNATVWTLQPTLVAAAHDPDSSPSALTYQFVLCDAANPTVGIASRTWNASPVWQIPANTLAVGKTYLWYTQAFDGAAYSGTQLYEFRVEAQQPPITSHLTQNSEANGLDPSIGNYTTSATDANVLTAGPALSIERDYNSKDPRVSGAFGAGWSAVLDAKVAERVDALSGLVSVVVTYPNGQQVAFGKTATGTFLPPLGRYATFATVTGGYSLTDKNQTVYKFTQLLTPGCTANTCQYGITSITDPNGRALTFTYTGGQITAMTSGVSGRVLHISWVTPSGASVAHVAAVSTDAAVSGDSTTVQTWSYSYTADKLTSVCPPTSATACTSYAYTSASRYMNTVSDLGPRSYWRLADPVGSSIATSQVLANNGADVGVYHNVTLGDYRTPLPGSQATSAFFDGYTSYVDLTQGMASKEVFNDSMPMSVSLWFNSGDTDEPLLSYAQDPISNHTTSKAFVPVLYLGSTGKLHAEFGVSGVYTTISTANPVNDNTWHHVVLAYGNNVQTFYLDGVKVGSLTGTVAAAGYPYQYIGAGFLSGSWPDQAWTGTAGDSYFGGEMADVAFFNSSLDAPSVTAMYSAGKTAGQLLSGITRPSGNTALALTYDKSTGRVASETDANGGTWTMSQPSVAGSSQVFVNSVLGASPEAYWRLNDTSGNTAKDQIHGGDATYSTATLGVASPFADGTTAVSFNGTSSYAQLPTNIINGIGSMSVSMWFKTTATNQDLLSYSENPITSANAGAFVPILYVGSDGKLNGMFWCNSFCNQLAGSAVVNDGNWHYVVLAGDNTGGGSQTLYLDGSVIGSNTGGVNSNGYANQYIGAGFLGGMWNDEPWKGQTARATYFNGSIGDVAYYRNTLSQATVQAQYEASKTSNSLITNGGATPVEAVNLTDPGGKTITYAYDPMTGNRLLSRTDGLGYTTRYGYDTGGFLNTVTDPNGNVVTTGHDVRGNQVSRTTCQNQATNACSTTYYTYYPDDTSSTLTPDARNDVVLTVRDGRSASATDNTYLTSYAYDTHGNRTGVTTPPVAGYPNGRTTTTGYSDGSATYPAVGGGNVPAGLPVKVTTPGGAITTTAYRSNGDIASVTDATGLVTSYTYDLLGRPTGKTDVSDTYPSGLTTITAYDKLNRPVTETDPTVTDRVTGATHTKQTTTVYDADGNITSKTVTDLTGGDAPRTWSAAFDNHDRLITATDPGNNATTYGYDGYGNKIKVVDPANTETDYAYDPNGNLITTTLKAWTADPVNPGTATDLVTESRAYDPGGRLATVTDAMGWVTSYAYTDDGLTSTITRSDPAHPGTSNIRESDTYDAAGNLTARSTNNGVTTVTRTVDASDRTTTATLDPAGTSRTATYAYSPDDAVLSTMTTSSLQGSGSTTVDATFDPMGRMTSQSVDNNASSGGPAGWWKLNETTGTVASDASGNQKTATLSSGASWSGGAAAFNGTSGTMTTTGRIVDTTQNFTVSAWANAAALSNWMGIVCQDAGTNSGFVLEYDLADNRWAFARTPTDTTNAPGIRAQSSAAPTLNTWVHLVGVFTATNGQLQLYVNGAAQGTATDTTPFAANGSLVIGRDKFNATPTGFFNGSVSNVQVYPRALSAAEVSTLYGNGRTGNALSSNRLTTTWTLDKRGLPTSSTDPNGNTTSYTYDEAGQLAIATAPTVNTETNGGTPVAARPVSMTGYDTFGARTEVEDPDGNVTTTGYDAAGRPVSTTAPSYTPPGGATVTPVAHTTYTPLSQVATTTDPLGNQTSYLYDQLGRLAKTTEPNLGVIHYTYDLLGDQLSATDPNGAVRQATYDYLGRKLTSTQVVRQPSPTSYTTSYAYNTTGGWLSSVTTPGNVSSTYAYDNVGETTSVTDAASNTTSYTYDYAGRVTKTTAPDGTAVTATYDAAGRQTAGAKTDTNGSTVLASTSAGYDSNGNPTSVTDALGHTSTFTFDATNTLTGEVQPISASASITTSFGYDAAGHRTRFTDGRGNAFITTYNTWGLPESTIEPSTPAYPNVVDRTFTTAYDANGRVATQTSPGGVVVTNTYDVLGDLTNQSGTGADAATTARTFGYDTAGRMTSASAPGGTDTFTLDDRGMLLSTSGPSGSSSFGYNSDALMTSRTDASGTSSYTYDTADRLKTITDASTNAVLTLGYNALSQPTQITYGAGADTRSIGYDSLHRLTTDALKTNSGSTIASITYGYDLNNNETSKSTVGFSGASNNTYTYDWANRLLTWNNGVNTSNYAYDNSGNRTQSGTQTFSYDARNRLTTGGGSSYAYTARGTLASVTTGSTTVTTTNDAFGQAITQGTQTYTYDALGRVITNATSGGATRTFTYTGIGNTLAADGSSTYSRSPHDDLIGIKTGASGVLAWTDLHTDVVGEYTTNATSLVGSTTYGPLGTIVNSSGMTGNLGYQSAFTEFNTGRVNMAARWYNPATGQFDNRDSVVNSPTPNSANANAYAYANDNPLTGTDTTGHMRDLLSTEGTALPPLPKTQPAAPARPTPTAQRNSGTGPSHHLVVNTQNPMLCARMTCVDDYTRKIHDVQDQLRQQLQAAIEACHHSADCRKGVISDVRNGDYNWVVGDDGTYTTTDGKVVITVTDLDQLKAFNAQQAADRAAAAKAADCKKHPISCYMKGNWHAIATGAKDYFTHHSGVDQQVSDLWHLGAGLYHDLASGNVGKFYNTVNGFDQVDNTINNAKAMWHDYKAGDYYSMGEHGAAASFSALAFIGAYLPVVGELGALLDLGVEALGAGTEDALGTAASDANAGARAAGAKPAAKTPTDEGASSSTTKPPAGSCSLNSFDPATPVLLANGLTKPIGSVKIGDQVQTTDPQTGITTLEPVTQLHINLDSDLTDLTLSTSISLATLLGAARQTQSPTWILHTTAHHPFWDQTTHQWTDAANLQRGDQLATPDEHALYVVAIHNFAGVKPMRNLTIADTHTYYVVAGNTPVLVHNAGGGTPNGLRNASPGLQDLFSDGSIRGNSIIQIRATLTGNGFTQTISNNGSGYLFEGPNGEQVRVMSRNGGWDVRVKNQYGNYLDDSGNVTTPAGSHGIIVECK